MRSIHAKVVLWTLGTFALSLAAFGVVSLVVARTEGPPDFFFRTVAHLRDEAVVAYEDGGPERLAAYLRRLDALYPAEHHLTDTAGRDLVSGADRSAQVASASRFPMPPRSVDGHVVFVNDSDDGRYRFVVSVLARFNPLRILPYYGAIVLAIAALAYALSAHLVRPVWQLRQAVDRFGQGELSSRARSTRRDEIGELSRAFDRMADRIEALLAAERRLLQDVSHELRSPLTRLGFAVGLARADVDRDAALDQITKETGRLSALVDELLLLNRSEDNVSARDVAPVNLNELVETLADDARIEADAKGCRLAVRSGEYVVVDGDWKLLLRAVENVLRNAVRYAPEGTEVEIDVRATRGTAVVAIRDCGPECRRICSRRSSNLSSGWGTTEVGPAVAWAWAWPSHGGPWNYIADGSRPATRNPAFS